MPIEALFSVQFEIFHEMSFNTWNSLIFTIGYSPITIDKNLMNNGTDNEINESYNYLKGIYAKHIDWKYY